MNSETGHSEDVKKLAQMIKGIDFGMLTTVDDDGTLRSRPMSANGNVEFDGDVWFFTYGNSHKVLEAQQHPQVNVAFSDPKNQNYVSLSGTAELVRDKAKIEELWEPSLKAWFPEGVDTPDIALLKVTAHQGGILGRARERGRPCHRPGQVAGDGQARQRRARTRTSAWTDDASTGGR